jgi:hypothetical protein
MNDKIEVTGKTDSNGELIAALPRDQLRSLFYLFSGKPDSRIKVFTSPIHLQRSDIVELNDCVIRKLKIHSIDASITSIKVGYVGSEINEFGTWSEFEAHHWQEPERIEEIVIKWDFLVNIQEYAIPQRHTLLVRISTDMKPGKVFQMLASGNSDEFDQLDMFAAPAFCRVDFINAQISKELINVINDWYKARKSPVLIPEIYYWFKKRKRFVAEIFDHWFQLSWAILVASLFFWGSNKFYDENVPNNIAVISLFLGIYSLRPIGRLANIMGGLIYNSLRELEGSRVVFEFTSGDKKKIADLKQENNKQGRKFLINTGWNLFLNVLACVIYAYLFTKSSV